MDLNQIVVVNDGTTRHENETRLFKK